MRKIKYVYFSILLSVFSFTVFGQTFEKNFFAEICNGLDKQNAYMKLKATVPSTYLIVDATTGQQSVKYGSSSKELDQFKKFSISKQMEILNVPELPIFPLKDTLVLLDTSNFFSEELEYKSRNTIFKLVSQSNERNDNQTVILGPKALRGSQLLMALLFKNDTNALVYQFQIDCSNFHLIKWTIVEKKQIKE